MEIIVDDREKAIIPHMETASEKYHIDYKVQRNTVGDYVIVYKGYILLVIERKTWTDLSASMRDGRKENIEKLIKLRESTGCQIAYLIEGNATPSVDKKYGRLPVKNLRAHLDHLAFRDGVHMIYSKDEEYTANRLFELAQNYFSIKTVIKEIDILETTSDEVSKVQDKQTMSIGINEQLLRCVPGVGSIISTLLAELGITILSLYNEEHTDEEISRIKYPTGSAVGIEKGRRIALGTKKMIDSSSAVNKKIHIRILSTVPLISKTTAEKILDNYSLSDIMSGNVSIEDIANIQRSTKSKIGKKAAENIITNLLGKIDDIEETSNDVDEPDEQVESDEQSKMGESGESDEPSKSDEQTIKPKSKPKHTTRSTRSKLHKSNKPIEQVIKRKSKR
jgi:ERCC4-type nuclease